MTLGPQNPERRQLNWAHLHRGVSSFLAKRVSLTEIPIYSLAIKHQESQKNTFKLRICWLSK